MNINFTVVVQLLNFFIAYLLIEWLLIRPAAAIIVKEDKERLALQNINAFNKERLEQKELDKEHAWQMLLEVFAKTMPRSDVNRPKQDNMINLEPQKPDEQTIRQVIEQSTEFLVARVGHD